MKGYNNLTGELVENVFVFDQVIRPDLPNPEKSDSADTKTEQSYIPPAQQIADQMKAGVYLNEVRRARFSPEFDSELGYQPEEEIQLDPTRDPGADMADVFRLAHATGLRLREQDKKDREAKKAAAEAAAAAELQAKIDAAVAAKENVSPKT